MITDCLRVRGNERVLLPASQAQTGKSEAQLPQPVRALSLFSI